VQLTVFVKHIWWYKVYCAVLIERHCTFSLYTIVADCTCGHFTSKYERRL